MFFARAFSALSLTAVLAAVAVGGDANAQQIFRIVGSDGRVTFSDTPPLERSAKAAASPVPGQPGAGNANLPFELRQVTTRYPVTLYSAPGCGPCGSGRALLASRGIPFAEKTVTTNEDIEGLKRLAGAASVPILTIGGQQLKGFSEIEWAQFLDLAGYPKTSQLPVGYHQPAATPLVAVQEAQPAAARTPEAAREVPRAAAPQPAPPNPAGIRF